MTIMSVAIGLALLTGCSTINTSSTSGNNGASHVEGFGGGFPGQAGGAAGGIGIRPADEGMTRPEDAGTIVPEDADKTKPADEGTTVPENAGMTKPENEGEVAEGNVVSPNNIVQTPGTTGETNTSENTVSSASDTTTEDTTSDSYKGIKAINAITIEGGTFDINAADDAIHTNNSIVIQNGDFTIETGDDDIHADALLAIGGGTININKSYEGLEGAEINIAGGTIYVTASDDGVNATDGSTETAAGGRPGEVSGTAQINISGGYLCIDDNGNTILSFVPSKSYQSVIISTSLLEEGKTYSFSYGGSMSGDATDGLYEAGTYTGGTKVTDFTISDSITYLSETGVTTGGSGFGQGGGMRPGGGQRGKADRNATTNENTNTKSSTTS